MGNPMILIIIVGALVVGIGGILIFIGLRNPRSYDDRELQSRLDEFNQRGEVIDLEKIELSLPFTERIIYPIARKLGEIAIRFTPQNALHVNRQKTGAGRKPRQAGPDHVPVAPVYCCAWYLAAC